MTTAMQDIVAVLEAAPTVTALVGDRIYPNKAPQGSVAAPYVVCRIIDSMPMNSMDGSAATRLENTHMQIDVYAKGYDAAQQAAKAIDLVISDLSGDLSAWREVTREDYDNETQLDVVQHDFSIWRR